MAKYHVHVYRVRSKAEIDIEAESDTKAREKALHMAMENRLKFTDDHKKEMEFRLLAWVMPDG